MFKSEYVGRVYQSVEARNRGEVEFLQAVREVMESGSILPSNVMYFRTARKGTDWASSRTYYGTYGGNCYFS